MIFFELTDNLYATDHGKQIIFLDVRTDQYMSLGGISAFYYRLILKSCFEFTGTEYIIVNNKLPIGIKNDVITLNKQLKYFLKNSFIKVSADVVRKNMILTVQQSGGLDQIEWHLFKNKSEDRITSFRDLLCTFVFLFRVHRSLKKRGVGSIVDLLKSYRDKKKKICILQNTTAEYLAALLDKACLIYPEKTLCLPWAATLALLMIKNGHHGSFVIGVQPNPFYAHAWVENREGVINDNPQLKERLAKMLSIDF